MNTTGTLNDVSKGLRAFLDYVHGGDVSDDRFVQELDKAVEKARTNREWRREYMTLYMWQQEIQEESRAEGLAAGRAEGLSQGLAQGRTEGGWLNIISIIRKKLIKQISPEDTADMLELDIDVVEDIMNCIRQHGDFDDEQIFAEVFGGK